MRSVPAALGPVGSLSAAALRRGSDRANPGLHPGLTSNPSKQPGLGLAQDHELCIVLGHPEEIQHDLLRFGQ
jgi:hypothetical protein